MIIYLYRVGDLVEPHTDKAFAEEVLELGEPIAELTEQQWDEAGGMARIIDDQLFLGRTEDEIQAEMDEAERSRLNDPALRLEALEEAMLELLGVQND